jgi:hypothetical protein
MMSMQHWDISAAPVDFEQSTRDPRGKKGRSRIAVQVVLIILSAACCKQAKMQFRDLFVVQMIMSWIP